MTGMEFEHLNLVRWRLSESSTGLEPERLQRCHHSHLTLFFSPSSLEPYAESRR